MLKVITVSSDWESAASLIFSLSKNGWDYMTITSDWKGFGTKLIKTYEYLKGHPEVTEFIFCDAFDVICLGTPDEFLSKLEHLDKMLISAERGLWPPSMQEYEKYYEPLEDHGFNYVNSGLYYSPSSVFITMMERNMPQYSSDDQEWMGLNFLFNDEADMVLDSGQKIFNSHSHMREGDYGYENGRVQILGNEPIFVHLNGRTVDEKLNSIL